MYEDINTFLMIKALNHANMRGGVTWKFQVEITYYSSKVLSKGNIEWEFGLHDLQFILIQFWNISWITVPTVTIPAMSRNILRIW